MLGFDKPNFIFNCVPKRSVRQIMKKADKSYNRSALTDKNCKLTRRESLFPVLRRTNAQSSVASPETVDDGIDQLVDLLENSDNVVNTGMGCVDKNAVRETQLSETV
jgi:hypothetical protein